MSVRPWPDPPAGRSGWPWERPSGGSPEPASAPRISLVTPSFEQGPFLEATLRSVLGQGYPNLEYVVIDGGSRDRSRQILERYAPWIDHWVSEPDGGQYDAIEKGFRETTGDVMAWLNSDDLLLPGALQAVGEIFAARPELDWLTTLRPCTISAAGRRRWTRRLAGHAGEAFWAGEYCVGLAPYTSGWIPQESTFWRRRLWRDSGGRMETQLDLAGDFELWCRFMERAELVGVDRPLAAFRRQPEQKTARRLPAYEREAAAVFARRGGRPHPRARAFARWLIGRLPLAARAALRPTGLVYEGSTVVPADGGWAICSRPV